MTWTLYARLLSPKTSSQKAVTLSIKGLRSASFIKKRKTSLPIILAILMTKIMAGNKREIS